MKRLAAILAMLLVLSACAKPPTLPLASAAAPSLAHKGCLHITLMDLTQTASGVTGIAIQAVQPDGAVLRQNVGSVEAGEPTVRFDGLDQAGVYKYAFADQDASAPLWQSAVLSSAHPAYEGQLQVAGASLLVQGVQGLFYAFGGSTYYLTVQNLPAGDRGTDLAMAMDGLPPGGEAVFTPPFLRSGQSGELRLTIPPGTTASSLTLTVQGYVGSQLASQAAALHPVKDWDLAFSVAVHGQTGSSVGSAYTLSATASISMTGRNVTPGSPLALRFVSASVLGYGATAPGSGSIQVHNDVSPFCTQTAYLVTGGLATDVQVGATGTAGWAIGDVLSTDQKMWWLFMFEVDLGAGQVMVPVYANWCGTNSCSLCSGQACSTK